MVIRLRWRKSRFLRLHESGLTYTGKSNSNYRERNMRSKIWSRLSTRVTLLCALGAIALFLCVSFVGAQQRSSGAKLRFELSFPESARQTATDGRLFVIIARTESPEPRLQIRSYDSTPFFGLNVDGLRPGQTAIVDDEAY